MKIIEIESADVWSLLNARFVLPQWRNKITFLL